MSKKQLNRFDVLSKAIDGFITIKEASEILGLSERQTKRLKKKVREAGASGVVHNNTGKPSSHRISDKIKSEVLRLRNLEQYKNSNFVHFREILGEYHSIDISYTALRNMLNSQGIQSPKTKRRKKIHKRRKRRAQAGLLLQTDATPFAWFSGDKKKYSIHGAIDDATGQITGLYMCKNECMHGYFEMLRRTVANFGIPKSIYADRHTIFQSPNTKKHEIDPSIPVNDTQFGRCLKQLGITLIAARSPQAKGRIERLWETLQSRLPVEFAMKGITDIDSANAFLENYIYEFNTKFAAEPENAESAFSEIDPEMSIDHILCIREKRVVDAGNVFSYGGKSFKITDDTFIRAKTKIDVLVGSRIGVVASYKEKILETLHFVPPKRKKVPDQKKERKACIPPENHAWKKGDSANIVTIRDYKFESEESYRETVRLIERTLLGKYR